MKDIKKSLAPICLFVYNRLSETKSTITALQKNYLAKKSCLFIFSDGAKNQKDITSITEVRKYINTITGFDEIKVFESKENKGLANSIISGVSHVINEYGRVIVLEDDLITSPNFLNFMNQSLSYYENHKQIFSISGYTMDFPQLKKLDKDYYLGYRASSWGWGTWKRSWSDIDWEIKDYFDFKKSFFKQQEFKRGGSDLPRMLRNQMNGKIDSWAIRWCYNQFKRNQYTVFPKISKIKSIGFGEEATHTKNTKRFNTFLDATNQRLFSFYSEIKLNKKILRGFRSKFSIISRLKDRL